jgi:hypothetical protein
MAGSTTRKALLRYWGYLLLIVLIGGWLSWGFEPSVLIALSAIAGLYFLVQAPTWCGARTRSGDFCRNNAHGLLMGCHLAQHRWQKVKMMAPRSWRRFGNFLTRHPMTILNGVAAVGTAVSGAAAVIQLFLQ